MTGIINLFNLIFQNWTLIILIASAVYGGYIKTKNYLKKSEEEKIYIAKSNVKTIILSLVTDAQIEWQYFIDAGEIKRSEVIKQVFELYPILSKVIDQESLIMWLDALIDETLVKVRNFEKINEKGDTNEV